MRKIHTKLLSLLIVAFAFSLVSCSSDDDRSEYTFTGSYSSLNIIENLESAKQPITLQGDDIKIDDMFKSYDYVKPITRGELNYNESNIKITGLSGKDLTLRDFTVIINGVEKKLGDISEDKTFPTKEVLDYLNESLKRVISQRQLNVKMKFDSRAIAKEDDIRLVINFNGIFRYLK